MLFVSRYLRHIVDQSIELVGSGVLERGGHVFPVLPETRRLYVQFIEDATICGLCEYAEENTPCAQ